MTATTMADGLPAPLPVPAPPVAFLPPAPPSCPRPGLRASRRARPVPADAGGGLPLPGEPPVLRWLGARFAAGEATVWQGPPSAILPLADLLYAAGAASGGAISVVEGANRFDPHRIAAYARGFGADPGMLLRRIRIARAFTVHQLVALVERWPQEARRHPPVLLVAHDLLRLFDSDAVPAEEREALLGHLAERLRHLTDRVRAPLLLLLEGGGGIARFPALARAGPRLAEFVAAERHPRGIVLRSYRDGRRALLVRRPDGQRGIEEFGGGSGPDTTEVIPWVAPCRPTGRPWTSA
ncbi:MAG: hypothetical protein QXG65_01895 [Thermoplasmata archaeon]